VEQGVRREPQRGDCPEADAALRPQQADDEGDAQEELDNADIAHEVLIEKSGVGHPGTSSYRVSGATSMKMPLAEQNRPLKATIRSTAASTAPLSSLILMIFLPFIMKGPTG
jgi:hypothetical protein